MTAAAAGPPAGLLCPIVSFPQFCGGLTAKNSAADLCSLADTYLAYTYLCKTGLWRQVTLEAHPSEGYVLSCDPLVPAADDADIDNLRDTADGGEGDSGSESGSEKGEDEQGNDAAAGAGGAAGNPLDPAAKELQRHRTVTVPMSLARGALSFARLTRLFVVIGAYNAKRLDIATVDNDGTVVVSHLYDYPLAPEPLVMTAEDAKKEDDDIFE